jgi:predicted Zn-dependent protease
MKRYSLVIAVSVALCAASLVYSPPSARADGLPDLGESAQLDLTPAMEKRIGEQAMRELRADPAWLGDAEVNAYLNRLGGRLTAHIEGPSQSFELFALRDPTLNAFAMVGGYLGVHTGLILAAESESELASVLAHEVSHITQHHQARMMSKAGQGQVATLASLAVAILAARSNPDVAMGAVVSGQAASIQNQLNYSRDFEREADRVGLGLLDRSGFDVRGMETFFGRMQKYGQLYDSNAPSYLRTHPLTSERLADIANRIQDKPYKQVPDSLEFQFVRAKLRAIDGDARDAVTYFKTQLKEHTYAGSEAAVHYGLSRAYLRAGDLANAESELAAVRRQKISLTMVDTLAAEIRTRQNDYAGAATILRAAYARAPDEQAVVYALTEALLSLHQPREALKIINDNLVGHTNDSTIHALEAKTYAALGQRLQQHRAQAEAYALDGRMADAIEQLQLAQQSNDGNFYELSQVDARLRQFRAKMEEEKKFMKDMR